MKHISSYDSLADRMSGRDNNFNLFRMLGAMTIVTMHFVEMSTRSLEYDFYALGYLALDFFFVASGFMITASILRGRSLLKFALARILRVFPAMIVVSFLIAFGVGALATTLPLKDYYSGSELLSYFSLTSLTLTPHIRLPGVFENLLFPGEVNTPIWTLKYEFGFYCLTASSFLLGIFKSKRMLLYASAAVLAAYLVTRVIPHTLFDSAFVKHTRHFAIAYMLGTLAFVFADRIKLHWFFAVGWGIVAYLLRDTMPGELIALVWAAYFTLWFAYLKTPLLRRYNQLGDYSYGTYILHWPIICLVVTLLPEASLTSHFVLGTAIVIPLAVLSWHFVEKPMLSLVEPLSMMLQARVLFPAREPKTDGLS